jgi:WD40 repeat protein
VETVGAIATYSIAHNQMEFLGHTEEIASVAISNDGLFVVSGSCDSTVRKWNALTGIEIFKFTGKRIAVLDVITVTDHFD